jgi:GNAT superfamily N-acetyltransferase
MSLEFRAMTLDDMGLYLRLMEIAGWGNTADDLRRLLHYEPEGCFIASLNGEDVGMVASTNYGEVGWIGNLVVFPKWRSGGIGTSLMKVAMGHLLDSGVRSIRLDSVAKSVTLYSRLGFRVEYPSLRFTGKGRHHQVQGTDRMEEPDLPSVMELDGEFSGLDRERMLRRVYGEYPSLCFVARDDEGIAGYIMAKPGEGIIRVGPWICVPESPDLADALLRRLMAEIAGEWIWVGVPALNSASVEILGKNGFGRISTSTRMCYGECGSLGNGKGVFGIGAADKG